MKKLILLLTTLTLLSSCKTFGPQNLPDGFAVAHTTVQGAQLALVGADGLFEIVAGFMSPERAASARQTYLKIRAAVVAGLQLALDGIILAEGQRSGFDLVKLLAPAEAAWQDLRAFLAALQGKGTSPASSPARDYRSPTVDDLPLTLLPAGR